VSALPRLAATLVAACFAAATAVAEPYRLAPFKDDLFGYPAVLESSHGGDFRVIEYDRERDLLRRDVVERLKVDPKYVSLETQAAEADLFLADDGRRIRYVAVGRTDGPVRVIVIFLHGRGTDRTAGADDWIHGGNFNRIKNLMMRNDGLYLSPDFADFGRRGAADVATLLRHYAARSPGAPVILGCASWGGRVCWRLLGEPEAAARISGLIFFDSALDGPALTRLATLPADRRPAIHVSNNAGDRVMGHGQQRDIFRRFKASSPDYPIRFTLFSGGYHGSSLRMTDWRETINWMLSMPKG
jgi:hypothetical protein